MSEQKLTQLQDLLTSLLGPNGCPWDKEQSPQSLCEYFIEESHEFIDAIRHGSKEDIIEEAGDTLFLLLFICTLYQKSESFSFQDVIDSAIAKMIRRHPHVFEKSEKISMEEIHANWAKIKQAEKQRKGVYAELPASLPSLTKAYRIHSKAADANFTWDSDEDVEQQVEAEWLELLDSFTGTDTVAQSHELGDIIFSLVELGRRKGIKANAALDAANHRFLTRFSYMEEQAKAEGKNFGSLSMEEKNLLWDKAKLVSK